MVGMMVGDEEEHRCLLVFLEHLLEFFIGVLIVVKHHDGIGGDDCKPAVVDICNLFFHRAVVFLSYPITTSPVREMFCRGQYISPAIRLTESVAMRV